MNPNKCKRWIMLIWQNVKLLRVEKQVGRVSKNHLDEPFKVCLSKRTEWCDNMTWMTENFHRSMCTYQKWEAFKKLETFLKLKQIEMSTRFNPKYSDTRVGIFGGFCNGQRKVTVENPENSLLRLRQNLKELVESRWHSLGTRSKVKGSM